MALKINLDAFDNIKLKENEKNIKKTDDIKENLDSKNKNKQTSTDLLNIIKTQKKEEKKYKTFYLPINVINKLEKIAKIKKTKGVNVIIDLINFIDV